MEIIPRVPKFPTFQVFADRMHETDLQELMDISGLWDLNEKKVEELLYLLVFAWSPRSEGWPR